MRRRTLASLAAVVALTAIGCGTETHPPSPAGPRAEVTPATSSLPCDFSALRRALGRYFAPGDQQTAFGLLKAMIDAGANQPAADPPGFGIHRLVEEANDGRRAQGTPAAGSEVQNQTLACMSFGPALALPIDLAVPLGATGLDGERGDNAATDQLPVFSHDCSYGIEPPAGGWHVLGPHVYIGRPVAEFRTERPVAGGPVDLTAIPTIGSGAGVVVGFALATSQVTRRERVEHGTTILPRASADFLLSCPFLAAAPGAPGPLARLGEWARAALGLVAPRPLFATVATLHSGVGGLTSSFSPFGGVDAGSVHLEFLTQPRDTTAGRPISSPPGVRVRARGDGGTPLPEVSITISVAENQGSFTLSGTTTRVTGADGIATFPDLSLDKPGGYTFVATAVLAGFAPAQVNSTAFHITF